MPRRSNNHGFWWLWVAIWSMGCYAAPLPLDAIVDPADLISADDEAPSLPDEPVSRSKWSAKIPRGKVQWRGATRDPGEAYAYTDPGSLPEIRDADGKRFPLRHTAVEAQLRGNVAEVVVTQTFVNDHDDPIDAVYTFPLPENAAVSDLEMVIGDRVIKSDIMTRKRARATYRRAKADGHTAALLEQERPNVFTQSVANIAPKESIDVEIRYLQTLTYDAGTYEFVFPMVVGPRFSPGTALGKPPVGSGTHPDTTAVPDASRISPPIAGPGTRTGHDVSLHLVADVGFPVDVWYAPTHDIDAKRVDGRLDVRLRGKDELPNRDFVLRYQSAGAVPRASLMLGPPGKSGLGHYLMVIQPPNLDVDKVVGRREMMFVIDTSGSMSGHPLALAKRMLRDGLSHLRPVDTFNVVTFASGTQRLYSSPRPANATNLAEALGFVDGLRAGGGTMMNGAVEAALRPEVGKGRNRYVMFLTDGYVGNEREIAAGSRKLVRRLKARGQVARVFGVGIGDSVNRDLIGKISLAGRGVPLVVGLRDDALAAVNRVMRYVDKPVVSHLRIDWGGLEVHQRFPAQLPDLFASHPTIVHGLYRGRPKRGISVAGKVGRRRVTIPVELLPVSESGDVLATLWARSKVAELEARLWAGDDDKVAGLIEQVGLDHRIVTAYTSFVAVDRSRTVGGESKTIVQPVDAASGVDIDAAGGVQLAGTSGYTVDGASVNNPSFGAVGSSMVQEFVEVRAMGVRTGGQWSPTAGLLIGQPKATARIRRGAIRGALGEIRWPLQHCFVRAKTFSNSKRRRLLVQLRFGPNGAFRDAAIVDGSLGDKAADRCLVQTLGKTDWSGVGRETVVQIPLWLWPR